MHPDMIQQIRDAQVELRKIKRASPYIFPEYTNLQRAKAELAAARTQYDQAVRAWKALGNTPV